MPDADHWNDPATVQQFASRDPDIHLVNGLASRARPGDKVLDLGAAGGRNTEYLAREGQRVIAVDTSPAMLAHIRQRCTGLEPRPALLRASMTALPLADESVDGVAAIGIYHQAESDAELLAALAETHRVLRPGGWLLISVFATAMLPPDAPRVKGQRHLYVTDRSTACRLSLEELLTMCAERRLQPDGEVQVRHGPSESGRVSLMGWFRAT